MRPFSRDVSPSPREMSPSRVSLSQTRLNSCYCGSLLRGMTIISGGTMVWRARSHRRSINIWWTSLAVWIIHGQRSRRTRPCNLYVPWMNRLFISISVVLVYPRSLSRFALLVLVVGNRDCYQIRYPLFCGLCEAQVVHHLYSTPNTPRQKSI